MSRLVSHFSYANVMSTLAVFVALGGGAYAAVSSIPGPDGVVHGCYQKQKGTLRVIKSGKKCRKKSEFAISWNQRGEAGATGATGTGAPGDAGARGADGSNATINGVIAGGSLTGTYPNPTLVNNSVSTSKFGVIPSARVTRSSDQTIPTGELTTMSFGTDVFRNGDLITSTPTAITTLTPGVYLVTATVDWGVNSTAGYRELDIYQNSTPIARVTTPALPSIDTEQNASTVVRLNVAEDISVRVRQTSGVSINVLSFSADSPVLTVSWIGSF